MFSVTKIVASMLAAASDEIFRVRLNCLQKIISGDFCSVGDMYKAGFVFTSTTKDHLMVELKMYLPISRPIELKQVKLFLLMMFSIEDTKQAKIYAKEISEGNTNLLLEWDNYRKACQFFHMDVNHCNPHRVKLR